MHVYEIRPRKFKRGFDLISDVPPFGVLWCTNADDAVNYANFSVEQNDAVIRVYDEAGNVIPHARASWRVRSAMIFAATFESLLSLTGSR